MKSALEKFAGFVVAGIAVLGVYAIAHDMFKVGDSTILAFVIFFSWLELANCLNKPDVKAS